MQNSHYNKKIISFLLCVSVITLSGALYFRQKSEAYEATLQRNSQRAYAELVSSTSNLESALMKAKYCASEPMLSSTAAQIWRETAQIKSVLCQFPAASEGLDSMQKFIAQSGEYAFTLIRRQKEDLPLSTEEYGNLAALQQTAATLADHLLQYQQNLGETLSFDAGRKAVPAGDFNQVPQEFGEYPTLTYDGPFSDHLEKQEAAFLKDKNRLALPELRLRAAEFLGVGEAAITDGGECGDRIPSYRFTSGTRCIELTQQGGFLLNYTDGRSVSAATLTPKQGAEKAAAYLESLGFYEMKQSYYESFEGTVTVNFCATQDGVALYPDLIKVCIALDNGQTIGFEAKGYLMNHKTRAFGAANFTMEQAEKRISPVLKVISKDRAMVPTDGAAENYCYEFVCLTPENTHCIVYINCATGDEQSILLLLESANGTLTA
ncbi:PepSY1/2 domain-containing protein [Acidaminobacterium chupaoyuni]